MRIIKYRQPIIHNGIFQGWHYWGYLTGDVNAFVTPLLSNDGTIRMSYVYTGRKDKDGTEIYEGDFVEHIRRHWYCPGHPEHNKNLIDNCEIYFDDERGVISERTIDLTRKNQPPYSSSGIFTNNSFNDERADENTIKVIGNIIENPELLDNGK